MGMELLWLMSKYSPSALPFDPPIIYLKKIDTRKQNMLLIFILSSPQIYTFKQQHLKI